MFSRECSILFVYIVDSRKLSDEQILCREFARTYSNFLRASWYVMDLDSPVELCRISFRSFHILCVWHCSVLDVFLSHVYFCAGGSRLHSRWYVSL